jgi:predicted RNA-binding Zn ribbon-like protein
MGKGSESSKKFLWVGNETAIDFINTDIVVDGNPVDLLESGEDYMAWLEAAGIELRSDNSARNTAKQGLQLAKELRSKLRSAFEKIADKETIPQAVLSAVNGYLPAKGRVAELRRRDSKIELRCYWRVTDAEDYVAPIAWAFAEFLAEADLSRVRKCKNPDCVLFFYDTSKSGTRTWCSLDICGNKMRMAASRERRQTSP